MAIKIDSAPSLNSQNIQKFNSKKPSLPQAEFKSSEISSSGESSLVSISEEAKAKLHLYEHKLNDEPKLHLYKHK